MAISVLRICLLLAILCVTDGQSTTAEDSHCSYTFKVPTNDCGQTPMEDQLTKSLLVALQTQVKLLARNREKLTEENIKQAESFRKLTDENTRLRREMTTFKAGIYENPFIVTCFNNVQLTYSECCTAINGHIIVLGPKLCSCSKRLHRHSVDTLWKEVRI